MTEVTSPALSVVLSQFPCWFTGMPPVTGNVKFHTPNPLSVTDRPPKVIGSVPHFGAWYDSIVYVACNRKLSAILVHYNEAYWGYFEANSHCML